MRQRMREYARNRHNPSEGSHLASQPGVMMSPDKGSSAIDHPQGALVSASTTNNDQLEATCRVMEVHNIEHVSRSLPANGGSQAVEASDVNVADNDLNQRRLGKRRRLTPETGSSGEDLGRLGHNQSACSRQDANMHNPCQASHIVSQVEVMSSRERCTKVRDAMQVSTVEVTFSRTNGESLGFKETIQPCGDSFVENRRRLSRNESNRKWHAGLSEERRQDRRDAVKDCKQRRWCNSDGQVVQPPHAALDGGCDVSSVADHTTREQCERGESSRVASEDGSYRWFI